MNTHSPAKFFPLGQIIISGAARALLHPQDVDEAIHRHAGGVWGDLASDRAAPTEVSDWDGLRLVSAYRDRHGTRFLIITEPDRNVSAVLLPEEFSLKEDAR